MRRVSKSKHTIFKYGIPLILLLLFAVAVRLLELAKHGQDIDPSSYQQLTTIEYVIHPDENSCGDINENDVENTEDEEECNRSKKMKTSYHQA